jgi:hypothetical protein
MIKLSEQMLMDEASMRAFYEQCGISKSTTEAAIKARRNNHVKPDEQKPKTTKRRPLGKFKDR